MEQPIEKLKIEFFKKFPEITVGEFACFADCSNGEPCVWDDDRPEDCSQASKGIKKLDCKYWKKAPSEDNFFYPKDVWNWFEPKIQSLTPTPDPILDVKGGPNLQPPPTDTTEGE